MILVMDVLRSGVVVVVVDKMQFVLAGFSVKVKKNLRAIWSAVNPK